MGLLVERYWWLFRPWFWFLPALVVRGLYLLEQGGVSPLFYVPLLDELEAVEGALGVLRGEVLDEPYFKAPGYGWLLAGVMWVSGEGWPWVIRGLQHLCGCLLVVWGAWLAGALSRAGRGRCVAVFFTGLVGAVYGPMVRLECNLSLDFWVVFFQSGMLCALVAWLVVGCHGYRWLLVAGFLGALGWLMRPTVMVVLPLLVGWTVWVWWRWGGSGAGSRVGMRRRVGWNDGWMEWLRGGVLRGVVFLLPVLFVMVGMGVRNGVVAGEWRVLPWQGGYNLFYGNAPGANGRYFRQGAVMEGGGANPTQWLAIRGYLEGAGIEGDVEDWDGRGQFGKVDGFWFERTVEAVGGNVGAWLGLMGRKVVYLVSDKEIFNYEDFDLQRDLSGVLRWLPGRFGLVFPLALGAVVVGWGLGGRRWGAQGLLWLYCVGLGGGIALYYVSGRMRMPLAWPMIVLSGVCVGGVWSLGVWRRVAVCMLVLLGGVVSWGDWWGVRSESMAYVDLARMSNAAWYRGDFEGALDFALEAELLEPDYPTLPRLKGQALYGLGRREEALMEFERSVLLLGDESSRRNVGVIRGELGLDE